MSESGASGLPPLFETPPPMTIPVPRIYRMGEISLLLSCDTTTHSDIIDGILKHHGFTADDRGGKQETIFKLNFTSAPVEIPDAAQELDVHASGLQLLCHDDYRFLRRADATAEIDLSRTTVRAAVPAREHAGDERRTEDLLLIITFSLIILLQHLGRYALHAAALCYRADEGLLVVGDSDSGKSTMTMHLVREGWNYISDDSILVSSSNGVVAAGPLRRDFALDPDAVEIFPEISSHSSPLFTDPAKRKIVPEGIFPEMRMERCIPSVLIFPELVQGGTSRLQPLADRDAFLRLFRQASFLTNDPVAAVKQIRTLTELVEQTSSFRLEAGNDIKRDSRRVSALLQRLMN